MIDELHNTEEQQEGGASEPQPEQIGTEAEIRARIETIELLTASLLEEKEKLQRALYPKEPEENEPVETVIDIIREKTPDIILPPIIDFSVAMIDQRIQFHAKRHKKPVVRYISEKSDSDGHQDWYDVREELIKIVTEYHMELLAQNQALQLDYERVCLLIDGFLKEDHEKESIPQEAYISMQKSVFDFIYAFIKDSVEELAGTREIDFDECCTEILGFESFEELTEAFIPEIWIDIIDRMSDAKGKTIFIDVATIRHHVLNQFAVASNKAQVKKLNGGVLPPLSSDRATPVRSPVIFAHDFIRHRLEEHRLHRMGMKFHSPLEGIDRELIDAVGVRIAGHDRDGNPIDPAADIALYSAIEEKFIASWRTKVKEGVGRGDNDMVMQGLNEFHVNGGHTGKFSEEQIRFIIRNGMIAFLELDLPDGKRATLGSVSAISRTPHGFRSDGKDEEWHEEAIRLFPQYDFSDLAIPFTDENKLLLKRSANKRLLICRSSILPFLNDGYLVDAKEESMPLAWRGKSLRRIGLAARGKFEIFQVAQWFGSETLTFNIGTVKKPDDQRVVMGNTASQQHNSWVFPYAWKSYKTEIEGDIAMFWTAYDGILNDGLMEFKRSGGLLTGKEWNTGRIMHSCVRSYFAIKKCIERRQHTPWLGGAA